MGRISGNAELAAVRQQRIARQVRRVRRAAAELAAREPIFHRPEFGSTRADFESMLSDDFW